MRGLLACCWRSVRWRYLRLFGTDNGRVADHETARRFLLGKAQRDRVLR